HFPFLPERFSFLPFPIPFLSRRGRGNTRRRDGDSALGCRVDRHPGSLDPGSPGLDIGPALNRRTETAMRCCHATNLLLSGLILSGGHAPAQEERSYAILELGHLEPLTQWHADCSWPCGARRHTHGQATAG